MGPRLPVVDRELDRAKRPAVNAPAAARLSVTDLCDLACVYCRPDKKDGYLRSRLDLAAWETVARGLLRGGVRRVRLTGGEPLLSPQIVELASLLVSLGFEDVALTTNATHLARLAVPLRRAGLHRLNVSIDSLDAARFARLTRGGDLARVLAGLDAAMAAGFAPIKLNTVLVRGENDAEVESIVEFAWARGLVPRFLELMPIGEGAKLQGACVPTREVIARLRPLLAAEDPTREADRGPAVYLRARRDASLRVGFITGTTSSYCDGCDRVRVGSDGTIRACLARTDGVPAFSDGNEVGAEGVANAIAKAWTQKPDGDFLGASEESARQVSMRAVGG